MAVEVLSGKVFLLITGASRGIGRQMAVTFSGLLEKGSKMLLLARSESGLKETADKLLKNPVVDYKAVDLSTATADQLSGIIEKSLDPLQFNRIVIIHNAASIGDVSKSTADMADLNYWRKYYDLNVFSPAILNSVVMKLFKGNDKATKIVINVTSRCALDAKKSLGYYCSGKAAREMYFKVFAKEYPDVNVLIYTPGPTDTDMLRTVAETANDQETRKVMSDLVRHNKALTPEQAVNRLLAILRDQKYKSGAHVDYADDI